MDLSEQLSNISLDPNMSLVIPALIVVGFALKQTPIPNWTIVWIVLLVGTICGIAVCGMNITGIINGLLAGGMAVSAHQAYKQTVNNVKK